MFLFTALVVFTVLFLLRRARGFGPPWAPGGGPFAGRSPEADAKRILAERFAKGEISTDEFMERASVLNWTPGSDTWEQWKGKKRKR